MRWSIIVCIGVLVGGCGGGHEPRRCGDTVCNPDESGPADLGTLQPDLQGSRPVEHDLGRPAPPDLAEQRCGDGVCGGDEPSRCCQDCGCANGQSCQADGTCATVPAQMTWSINDRCYDGESIYARLFDIDELLYWPSGGYFSLAPGSTYRATISCTPNDWICFGGYQPNHGWYWGLDIDASKSCTDCCFRCANTTLSYFLTCS
jgi:hypothetical protein